MLAKLFNLLRETVIEPEMNFQPELYTIVKGEREVYDSMRTTMDQMHMNLHWKWSNVVLTESYMSKSITVNNSKEILISPTIHKIFETSILQRHTNFLTKSDSKISF